MHVVLGCVMTLSEEDSAASLFGSCLQVPALRVLSDGAEGLDEINLFFDKLLFYHGGSRDTGASTYSQ